MTTKVELIPVSEGNRITVEKSDKVIVGRGSSLGCNDKKISRNHAELLFKDDHTLWIKPTHTNPVFYRSLNGKITQLTKGVERELKEGDQIGLLPSSFYFRVSFTTEVNNNHESDSDTPYESKKAADLSPVRASSPDPWSPKNGSRHSSSNPDASVFDFDDERKVEKVTTPAKRTPVEKKVVPNVTVPRPASPAPAPATTRSRISAPRSSPPRDSVEARSETTSEKTRKLPKWMLAATPSPVAKPTPVTPSSAQSRKSSSTTGSATAKRHLSFDGDSDDASNTSDVQPSAPTTESKSPARVLSKIPSIRSFDSDNGDGADAAPPKTPPVPKKLKSGGKRRPACQFGATCYRKNPLHRAEQSHPGDSDHEDNAENNDTAADDTDADKPDCPFGKACYRQNPQHKREFKH